jgi:pyoverdine/dityrosine biosynthesis protein Dit1
LNTMCARVREVYSPGLQVTIISDGITYNGTSRLGSIKTWLTSRAVCC